MTSDSSAPTVTAPLPTAETPKADHAAATFKPRFGALWSLLMVVVCTTAAELFLKLGGTATAGDAGANPLGLLGFTALNSWYTVIGIIFHLAGFGAWMYTLRSVPLSLAYNFTMITQVTVALGSWWILKDPIPATRVIGIGLVLGGVFLLVPAIVAAEKKTEEPS